MQSFQKNSETENIEKLDRNEMHTKSKKQIEWPRQKARSKIYLSCETSKHRYISVTYHMASLAEIGFATFWCW